MSVAELETAPFDVTRARWAGYADVLDDVADVRVRAVPVGAASAPADEARCLLALSRGRRPTPLLCMSDQLAFGALRAAAELGLDVLGAVSIVGFDDVPAAARAGTHGLTTVRQPLRDKGTVAADAVVAPPISGPATHLTLPVGLVVRGSTAPRRRAPGRSRR